MTIQICLLGTGGPDPLPERQGPAVLLSYRHQHLVVDAGRGVVTRLIQAGIAPHELSAIALTHHHADHLAGLGDLLITAWHGGTTYLPVVGPTGTDDIVRSLFQYVYHREIAFSRALAQATARPFAPIEAVARVTTIAPGQTWQHGVWQITAASVEHGHALGLTYDAWPCLAYRVQVGGASVVISGDTIMCDSLIALAQGADLLVQCCFLADSDLKTPADRLLAEAVITTSQTAGKIAARAGVKALVLTHFGPMTHESLAAVADDVRRVFAGQFYLGADLLTLSVEPPAASEPEQPRR